MNIFPRMEFGDPILRLRAKPVPTSLISKPGFQNLIRQMFYTMHRAHGVGLAAPQIGLSLQLVVIALGSSKKGTNVKQGERIVVINPKILWVSKEKSYDWEGCLSFNNVRGRVPRHRKIKVRYTTANGEMRERMVSGYLARVFQHEIDHLEGKVYVDRIDDMKTLMTTREFRKRLRRGR